MKKSAVVLLDFLAVSGFVFLFLFVLVDRDLWRFLTEKGSTILSLTGWGYTIAVATYFYFWHEKHPWLAVVSALLANWSLVIALEYGFKPFVIFMLLVIPLLNLFQVFLNYQRRLKTYLTADFETKKQIFDQASPIPFEARFSSDVLGRLKGQIVHVSRGKGRFSFQQFFEKEQEILFVLDSPFQRILLLWNHGQNHLRIQALEGTVAYQVKKELTTALERRFPIQKGSKS